MEQELRFGLDMGWWAILKKKLGADYEQLLRAFFLCFRGQNLVFNFFENPIVSALKSCIRNLKFYSLAPLETPQRGTSR